MHGVTLFSGTVAFRARVKYRFVKEPCLFQFDPYGTVARFHIDGNGDAG
jgi:hypothetical protein